VSKTRQRPGVEYDFEETNHKIAKILKPTMIIDIIFFEFFIAHAPSKFKSLCQFL